MDVLREDGGDDLRDIGSCDARDGERQPMRRDK